MEIREKELRENIKKPISFFRKNKKEKSESVAMEVAVNLFQMWDSGDCDIIETFDKEFKSRKRGKVIIP